MRSIFLVLVSISTVSSRPTEESWSQQAGNDWRTSAIYRDESVPGGRGYASFSYVSLGRHVYWQYEGLSPSTPIPTQQGLVLITDHVNAMRAYTLPELTSDGKLALAWTYSGSANGAGIISKYSGTPAVTANGHAYWVNTDTSSFWGLNTSNSVSNGGPVGLTWSPINLTALTPDQKHFHTWDQESSLLLHDSHVWIPAHDEHLAVGINVNGMSVATTNLSLNTQRMFGSVGTTAESGHSVAFTSTGMGVIGLKSNGEKEWQTNVNFVPPGQEFMHPVLIEMPGTATRCIVVSKSTDEGLFIAGVSPTTGKTCLGWNVNGYTIRTKWTANARWVTAPATIDDADGVLLFYGIQLPNTDGQKLSSLVSIKVDYYGPLSQYTVNDAVFFQGAHINTVPVAFLEAFGYGTHGIAVALSTGDVLIYNHRDFSYQDPIVSYSGFDVLPMTRSDKGVEICGNYMSATSAGTLLMVAYDIGTNDTYLVAIARATGGYAPAVASPSPFPVGPVVPDAAATGTGATPAQAAGAIMGTLGALGVAAAGIVFFLPKASFRLGGMTITPADSIRNAAGSVRNLFGGRGGGGASSSVGSVGSGGGGGGGYAMSSVSSSSSGGYGSSERGSLLSSSQAAARASSLGAATTGYNSSSL